VKMTRRHARALGAGAATTLAYLAGGKVSDSPRVRGGALLLIALTSTAGLVRASEVAKKQKKRLDDHIAATAPAVHLVSSGGTIGGALTVSGQVTANGGVQTNGAAVSTSGGNVNAGAGSVTCGALTANGTCTLNHIVMGGNINMSGNNVNTASAYVVSGAPHRADLTGTPTNTDLRDRVNFFNDTLISEGLLS
jgi:cytoskeletal protein CcmA (bactofilin family)